MIEKKDESMKIIYISSMFDDSDLEKIFLASANVSYAANKYNKLLCEGLACNQVEVQTISILPVTRQNCKKIIVKKKREKKDNLTFNYLTAVNLPGLKHIFHCCEAFFRVLFAKRNTVIMYDLFALSPNIGMNIAARLRRFKRICILTDMPEHLTSSKKMLRIEKKLISDATSYIFLTKQMNEKVNSQNKPAIVLEGHIDYTLLQQQDLNLKEKPKESERIIMYAGALHERYGVANLVQAFVSCHKQNEVLHLYGIGDYVDTIRHIAKEHPCIRYCGVKPNNYIVEAEKNADLLVNPRTSSGEYTKYSFPSKILEYMASGTPVLMAKLPGIPDEYYDYVYTFDDQNTDGLSGALRFVLDKNADEIASFGLKARDFVFSQKTNVTQAKKIIDWIHQQ